MNSENGQALPDRIYAIGDIHGCSDLLDRLVQAVARDLNEYPVEKRWRSHSAITLIAGPTRVECWTG
jgi:serine/threonine protein phosphatase 1